MVRIPTVDMQNDALNIDMQIGKSVLQPVPESGFPLHKIEGHTKTSSGSSGAASEADSVCGLVDNQNIGTERWPQWNVGRIRLCGIFVNFKNFLLLLGEFAVITMAIYYCYAELSVNQQQAPGWMLAKSLIAAAPFSLCFAGLGLYSSRQTLSVLGVFLRFLVASLIAIPLLWVFHFLLQTYVTATDFVVPVMIAIVFLAGLRMLLGKLPESNLLKRRVLVVGAGEKVRFVKQIAIDRNQRGFSLVDATPDLSVAGSLVQCIKHHRVNEVVVAFDDRRKTLPAKELLDCRLSGVSVVDILDFLERETGVILFEHLQPSWLIFTDGFVVNIISRAAKRIFDIISSVVIIVLTSPIILITCLAIKLDRKSPGPIIYRQIRVGLNGENYNVLKFRSMRVDAEKNGQAQWATENDPRISAVGRVLRKCRIDELPQLFNVLTGSMSLVGPRPERPVFVNKLNELNELYTERHRVKPGVTGWAQLRFPYTDNENDSILKLQYDMYYLKNQGLLFDFYILLQTIEVVLFGKGSR